MIDPIRPLVRAEPVAREILPGVWACYLPGDCIVWGYGRTEDEARGAFLERSARREIADIWAPVL